MFQAKLAAGDNNDPSASDDSDDSSSDSDEKEDSGAVTLRLKDQLECIVRDIRALECLLLQTRRGLQRLTQDQCAAVLLGYPELLIPGYRLNKKGNVPAWLQRVQQRVSFGGFLLNISKADFGPEGLVLISGRFN